MLAAACSVFRIASRCEVLKLLLEFFFFFLFMSLFIASLLSCHVVAALLRLLPLANFFTVGFWWALSSNKLQQTSLRPLKRVTMSTLSNRSKLASPLYPPATAG